LKARTNFNVKKSVPDGVSITRNNEKIFGSKDKKNQDEENLDKEKKTYKKAPFWIIIGYYAFACVNFFFKTVLFYFFPLVFIVFPIGDLS